MKVAALVYREEGQGLSASLAWIDPFAGLVEHSTPVPRSPNLGLFPEADCALISYTDGSRPDAPREVLDVYRLSDWGLRARLPMDCRAHFNLRPRWSPFLPSPDGRLVYVYKARTLGDHLAEDYVCGLRLDALEFDPWVYKVPECVAGWSTPGGPAHAQMLFVADGLEVGRLPTDDLEQKVAFWLGPEAGMGPTVPLGPRPRVHSDLGHARAILGAPARPLSVVVCNDGVVHLIDPVGFRHLGRQRVAFQPGEAMPLFAAQVDPGGRFLYAGTAGEARHEGLVERVIVHDLERGRTAQEWPLAEPWTHMALSQDGRYLCGAELSPGMIRVVDTRDGRVVTEIVLDGSPRYLIPTA
jgi:hypothetical protein